jgi:hypothetical protein
MLRKLRHTDQARRNVGVNEVIQSEPEPSNNEQALLAAANSEIDFLWPLEADRVEER